MHVFPPLKFGDARETAECDSVKEQGVENRPATRVLDLAAHLSRPNACKNATRGHLDRPLREHLLDHELGRLVVMAFDKASAGQERAAIASFVDLSAVLPVSNLVCNFTLYALRTTADDTRPSNRLASAARLTQSVRIQTNNALDPAAMAGARSRRAGRRYARGFPMAHDAPQATGPSKLVIRNIGLLLSGAMERPILDADTITAENGRITAVGRAKDVDTAGATTIVDAHGTTVAPGLIDSHVHPVAGDWTPRQSQINWIDSYLHGGVTTMISAGEVHMPGRPRDVVGLKAMAIFAQRAFWTLRPGGVKVHAGAPVIECEMVEEDFKELAAAGVKLLGEVGLGGVKDGPTARKMVGWARKYGIQSTIHTGGPSIPGSGLIDKDVVLEADTDVVGHINGGHTALPDDQIRCICEGCKRGLELVHNGNERSALFTLRTAREMGDLSRIILGTDAPAGSGVQPLGILRMVSMLSSLGEVPAEIAFCFATGNTARMRALDCGLIEVGRAADFVIMDRAQHSPGKTLLDSVRLGDLPGVGMTIIDGLVRTQRSRNTPPATKVPEIVGK
jgi:enamidase